MLTVHYLENSRAQRILWLLEELNLPYEIRHYQRGPNMEAPQSLKAVHPLGKSPVITDDGLVVAESGAIIDYLLDTYGTDDLLRPAPGTPERRHYDYWLHYAEGSAMPLLVMKLVFMTIPQKVPFFIRPVASLIAKGVSGQLLDPQIADHIAYWQAELARHGWFAADRFTAADIMMSFPVEAGADRIAYGADCAAIRNWTTKIRQRPAYQRALKSGGAYAYAGTNM